MRSYLERPLDLAVNPMAKCLEDRTDAFLAHGRAKVQGNTGRMAKFCPADGAELPDKWMVRTMPILLRPRRM
jgi:hypothetical protein